MHSNRRVFLLGALAAPIFAAKKQQAAVVRPNIVLILAEELGAYMLGCYGNTEARTPNVDGLAQTGVRFAASFACTGIAADAAPFAGAGYNSGQAASPAQAAAFLDAQAPAKPFFLVVNWPSPNAVRPEPKILESYAATGFESIGWESMARNATHKDMLRDPQGNLRKYAASLTTLDAQLPVLLAKLQQRGVAENTLVVFTSNGGYLLGRHGLWGGLAASEPPNMYEEAVRTPLIWSWSSRFPPQTVRNDVVNSYDLMPAIRELADVPQPPGDQRPTYLPFVYGRRMPKKQLWPDLALGRSGDTEMARDGRYKLVLRNQGKGPGEFYDEVADAREASNEYDNPKFANMRERLTGQLAAWRGARR